MERNGGGEIRGAEEAKQMQSANKADQIRGFD